MHSVIIFWYKMHDLEIIWIFNAKKEKKIIFIFIFQVYVSNFLGLNTRKWETYTWNINEKWLIIKKLIWYY